MYYKLHYNKLATEIHEWNKEVGWWDNPNPCIYEKLQLVSTEVAECTEGERKKLMDTHLPHRLMAEVELADCMIRVLDVGAFLGLEYEYRRHTPHSWCSATDMYDHAQTIGKQHLGINFCIIMFAGELRRINPPLPNHVPITDLKKHEFNSLRMPYKKIIDSIVEVAHNGEYDLIGAMEEKQAYNKTRIDHTRAHRASFDDAKRF